MKRCGIVVAFGATFGASTVADTAGAQQPAAPSSSSSLASQPAPSASSSVPVPAPPVPPGPKPGAAEPGTAVLSSSPPTTASMPTAPRAPTAAVRAEAGERFDRGLRLFNGGDNAGALVEFRRAYELVPNVTVLYNIGLVYSQMSRAVEATDALNQVLAAPGQLSSERLAIARRTRDDQAARIAEIAVAANVEGARVEVDGIESGQTPLAVPLRVQSGTHVIGLIAPGYSPQRKEVAIASGDKQALKFELVAMQGRLAHLLVRTHVAGADLFVDDQRVATTPLSASISMAPGAHRIELRRAGYTTAVAPITLGDGASGEVTLEPEEDRSALASTSGRLLLDVTETAPVVIIDGRPRGVYASALPLAPGPHHLLVERGDFEPAERDFSIEPGHVTSLRILLEPTPEFRAHYVGRAQSQRTWGWISVVAGAALAAGGAALAAYDAKQRSEGDSTIRGINAMAVRHSGELCDPAGDTGSATYQTLCAMPYANATTQVSDANSRDGIAWSGVGVGAAAVALGVVLLLTDDPHKYDGPAPPPENSAVLRAWPTAWMSWGAGGVGVAARF
jgi:hypothetical protein